MLRPFKWQQLTAVLPNFLQVIAQMCNLKKQKADAYLKNVTSNKRDMNSSINKLTSMLRISFFFMLFGLSNFCFGQNDSIEIKGWSLSEDKQRPLKNVEVIIEVHGKQPLRQLTKDDGKFYFKLKRTEGTALLYTQTNKKTTDGKNTGEFLQCKDSQKFDLMKADSFTFYFHYKQVVH